MASQYSRFFYAENRATSQPSAEVMVSLIAKLVQPESVVDVGCGLGGWLEQFRKLGIEDVLGVDGDYVDRDMLLLPQDCFKAHDVRQPLSLERRFDLAMSLEVGEHIPEELSSGFVDTLTSLSDVVIFSAAIPGQGGTGHINEQWPQFWASLFEKRGYTVIDCLRSEVWDDDRVQYWYSQNTLLFVKAEKLQKSDKLRDALRRSGEGARALVHPRAWKDATDFRKWGFKKVIVALPFSLWVGVSRRFSDLFSCVLRGGSKRG